MATQDSAATATTTAPALTFGGYHAANLIFDVAAMLHALESHLRDLASPEFGHAANEGIEDSARVARAARRCLYSLAREVTECTVRVDHPEVATKLRDMLELADQDMTPSTQGGAA